MVAWEGGSIPSILLIIETFSRLQLWGGIRQGDPLGRNRLRETDFIANRAQQLDATMNSKIFNDIREGK